MKTFSPLRFNLKVQLIACACLSFLAFLLGKVYAYSLLLGAGVFIVPNMYFTYYAFRYRASLGVEWIHQSFMIGAMGKLSLALVGFALVFTFVSPLHIVSFFTGFIVMIILQWWSARYIANTVVVENE